MNTLNTNTPQKIGFCKIGNEHEVNKSFIACN